MIKHLFKLIWNKKKQNSLLITEIFVSFLVVFAVFTLLVNNYKNFKEPMGMDYNDVWVINYEKPPIKDTDSADLFIASLKQMLRTMPQVKEFSFSTHNIPFSMSSSNSNISYNNQHTMANYYGAEDSYARLLNIKMQEGRWFAAEDNAAAIQPVVINQKLKEKLFGNTAAVGKLLGKDKDKQRIIGVADNVKSDGDYQEVEPGLYRRMDTAEIRWSSGVILLKMQPGTGADFESKLYKQLASFIGTTLEIEHLDEKRVSKNKMMLVSIIVILVVAGFLIINVALGLFGVLWYNINKRKGEIGLRRAVGASGNAVSKQLVGEALVLSTIALIIGSFFAVQFPLMNVFDISASTYSIAIGLSLVFIYLLVMICALYPGRQAGAIYPAVALHEE